jgi:hypothetical protein
MLQKQVGSSSCHWRPIDAIEGQWMPLEAKRSHWQPKCKLEDSLMRCLAIKRPNVLAACTVYFCKWCWWHLALWGLCPASALLRPGLNQVFTWVHVLATFPSGNCMIAHLWNTRHSSLTEMYRSNFMTMLIYCWPWDDLGTTLVGPWRDLSTLLIQVPLHSHYHES